MAPTAPPRDGAPARSAIGSVVVRDALLSIPVAVIVVMASATNDWAVRPDSPLTTVATALAAVAVLMWRRARPLASWAAALLVAVVVAPIVLRSEPGQVILAFSTYSLLANDERDRVSPAVAGVAAYLAALAGSILLDVQLDGVDLETLLMPALSVLYGVGLGAVVRSNRRVAADLAERNAELVALHDVARREAVLAERARIARDLHDIVAHHVSGMVVQAKAARHRGAVDRPLPPEVDEALGTIATSGTEALESMRSLLGMVRDAPPELAPQPGLADLDTLVASTADRGLPTTLVVDGDVSAAPVDVQLSAYRIVQEALTNAVRHARARRAAVTVERCGGELRVVVDDDGIGPALGHAEGHGLVGMRERAALVGGRVELGSSPSGGWRVSAALPVGAPAGADPVRDAPVREAPV